MPLNIGTRRESRRVSLLSALHRTIIIATMVLMCSCVARCDPARDSTKCETDIRSELGAEVGVASETIWFKDHGNYTTVFVHIKRPTDDSEPLRARVETLIHRDYRIPVDRVVFQ